MPPKQDPRDPAEMGDLDVRHYTIGEILTRMRPLIADRWGPLILAMVLMCITSLGVALMPLLPKIILDVAVAKKLPWVAFAAAGGFLGIALLRMMAFYFSTVIMLFVGEEVVFRMRQRGFRHIQRLCLRFHSRYPSGAIYNRVFENAICQIGMFFRAVFSNIVVWITSLLFSLVVCIWLSPLMAVLVLGGAVGYVVVARKISPRIRRRSQKAMESHNWIAGYILDKLRGTKTIQAFSMEDAVDEDFDARVWPRQVKWIVAQREVRRLHIITEGLGYLIAAGVWVLGAHLVIGGKMQQGTLVAFVGFQMQMTQLVNAITQVYGQSAVARAGFDLYHTVLDTQSTIKDAPTRAMPEQITGRLALEKVTFSYDQQNRPALAELDLAVEPGQTVALVGRSGGGKSTIANLLLRFYDPDAGRVTLDGVDIRELPLRPYRSLFGVVLQEPFLFNDTVEVNLRSARPQASRQEMLDALARSEALEFVNELPDGLDSKVGEEGHSLSGGQRQRLAIARCLLMDPKFLILDEATSALDNETERQIQQALDVLFENRTAFVIAHRLSTIRRADRILVIEDGCIQEEGNFEQLLRMKGRFHRLYTIATSTSTRDFKIDEAGFA